MNQRNQQRSSGSNRPNRARPWNVYYPREYTVRGEGGGSDTQRTDFIRVGAAFPLRDKEGITIELQLPLSLPVGTRLIAMPRDDQESEPNR